MKTDPRVSLRSLRGRNGKQDENDDNDDDCDDDHHYDETTTTLLDMVLKNVFRVPSLYELNCVLLHSSQLCSKIDKIFWE